MYEQTTSDVKVTVTPLYSKEDSIPNNDYHVWVYTVTIENNSNRPIQLLNRYWKIVDSYGHVEEVQGAGVVGKQPQLEPGEKFQYSSSTHLNSSSGMMFGVYEMLDESNNIFDVEIPAFPLDTPTLMCAVH
jgi:ApaG protein